MLASVFSTVNTKRNKAAHKSRKFSSIGLRRAQSPPSPASFVSPEIVEINEKGPFGATYAEDPDREPGMSIDRSVTSPQIQLSFETSESLSEWLRPNIMSPENRTPPRRNVSLPNGGRDISASSSSSKARVSPELSIKEEKEEGQLLEVSAPRRSCSAIARSPCTSSRIVCTWIPQCIMPVAASTTRPKT